VGYASSADIPDGALLHAHPPVVLTDAELTRLSPVTKYRQTVIGCDQLNGWLHIWGFFKYGHAWVQHSAGDPPAVPFRPAEFPPDCLTITVEGPKYLSICRGRTSLVQLHEGRVIFPQANLFAIVQNPLGSFFRQLTTELQKFVQYRDLSESTAEHVGQRSLLSIYTTSVLAILERNRLSEHAIGFIVSQESLTNARRYSQSDRLLVRLTQRDDYIRVEVQDWGIGFNPKTVNDGHYPQKPLVHSRNES
jgi:hypothetical protein